MESRINYLVFGVKWYNMDAPMLTAARIASALASPESKDSSAPSKGPTRRETTNITETRMLLPLTSTCSLPFLFALALLITRQHKFMVWSSLCSQELIRSIMATSGKA